MTGQLAVATISLQEVAARRPKLNRAIHFAIIDKLKSSIHIQGPHQDFRQGRQKVESHEARKLFWGLPILKFFAHPVTLCLQNPRVGTRTPTNETPLYMIIVCPRSIKCYFIKVQPSIMISRPFNLKIQIRAENTVQKRMLNAKNIAHCLNYSVRDR